MIQWPPEKDEQMCRSLRLQGQPWDRFGWTRVPIAFWVFLRDQKQKPLLRLAVTRMRLFEGLHFRVSELGQRSQTISALFGS